MYRTETEDTYSPSKALHREMEKETLPLSFFTASKVQGVGSWYLYCDKQAIYKKNEETVVLTIESNYVCMYVDLPVSQTDTLYLN